MHGTEEFLSEHASAPAESVKVNDWKCANLYIDYWVEQVSAYTCVRAQPSTRRVWLVGKSSGRAAAERYTTVSVPQRS